MNRQSYRNLLSHKERKLWEYMTIRLNKRDETKKEKSGRILYLCGSTTIILYRECIILYTTTIIQRVVK